MHFLNNRNVIVILLIWLAVVFSVKASDSQTIVLIRLQAEAGGAKLPLFRAWQQPTIRARGVSPLGRPFVFERWSLSLSDYQSGWAEVILEPGIYDVNFNTMANGNPLQTSYSIKILPDMPALYLGSAVTHCDTLKRKQKSCANFDFIDESALAANVYSGALKTAVLGAPNQFRGTMFRSAYHLIEENGVNIEINSSALPTVFIGGTERNFSKASKLGMAIAGIALAPVLMLAPSLPEAILHKGKNKEKTMQAQVCVDALHEKAPFNDIFYKEFKLVDNMSSTNPAELIISPQNFILSECQNGFLCFETEFKFALLERKHGYNIYSKTLKYSSDPGDWSSSIYSDMLGGDGGKISIETLCNDAGAEFLKSEYAKAIAAMSEVIRSDLQVVSIAPK